MIIWINGAYGSGKTTISNALHSRLDNSYIYDPENAGNFVRNNFPSIFWKDDFQDFEIWRMINFEMIKYIVENYEHKIIVPMSIVNENSYNEIILKLSELFVVKHFILYAGFETILKRNLERGEEPNSWCIRQIDRCINAFNNNIKGTIIDNENRKLDIVVDEIIQKIKL